MENSSEHIWQRFRGSLAGRLFAAAVIAAEFGALAAVEVSPTPATIVLSGIGAAVIGVGAVGFLELRDCRRSRSPEWHQRIARTTEQVRGGHPGISPEDASVVAKAVEEDRFTAIAWVGMVLGWVSILCGVAMVIAQVVELFRTP